MRCAVQLLLGFTLHEGCAAQDAPRLEIRKVPAGLAVYRAGQARPLLVQHCMPDSRPYIHPIHAPDGKGVLTEDMPGHHVWQHGLYVGLHGVNGQNFWEKEDCFSPKSITPGVANANQASWTVVTDWTKTPKGATVLTETQVWTLTDNTTNYELDLVWKLTAAEDITFGQHAYGGLFIRMPVSEGAFAINSEGRKNQDAEQQKARWVCVSTPIKDRDNNGNICIMDHRQNAGHPVPWRVDSQFGVAPSRCILGDWRLAKGATETNRYRVRIFTGKPDAAALDASWNAFVK